MTPAEKRELLLLLEEQERRAKFNRLATYQPYAKQAEFHALSAVKRERMLAAGNQLGKTLAAAAESAIHLTGRYPADWQGRRFGGPISAIAGSESGELTRRGVQRLLFGDDPKVNPGTGMIPGDSIISINWSRHVNDLMDTARIRHVSGGTSTISLKSYDQGRGKWQAETVDLVWLDEEPEDEIYFEAMTRTNVRGGLVMVTCTLLNGMTNIAKRFWLDRDKYPSVGLVVMTIHDVGHYSAERKAEIIAGYEEHDREARTMGVPSMGSGRVFQVSEADIKIDPFPIPGHWPQIGGMDFGWDHPFAAARLAWDRDTDVLYVTSCYRERKKTPLDHCGALRPWGDSLPWAWPHDGLQHDKGSGEQLAEQYRKNGLRMIAERATFPDGTNGLEAGVTEMHDRMRTGRLKVFSTCGDWFDEFRTYHRDNGLIVKKDDDLISATRYAMMMRRFASTSAPVSVDFSDYAVDY